MKTTAFNQVVECVIKDVRELLIKKGAEYADSEDRLANFNKAALMLETTPEQALLGFKTKHTVSIVDMIQSGQNFPVEKWKEKILDEIAYDICLMTMVIDKHLPKEIETKDDANKCSSRIDIDHTHCGLPYKREVIA